MIKSIKLLNYLLNSESMISNYLNFNINYNHNLHIF